MSLPPAQSYPRPSAAPPGAVDAGELDLNRWLLRIAPGERWFPADIFAVDASLTERLPAARRLRVDVSRDRHGMRSVLSRDFPCVPAYACYRDLCEWLGSVAAQHADAEERVVEWSSAVAEQIVDATHEK